MEKIINFHKKVASNAWIFLKGYFSFIFIVMEIMFILAIIGKIFE